MSQIAANRNAPAWTAAAGQYAGNQHVRIPMNRTTARACASVSFMIEFQLDRSQCHAAFNAGCARRPAICECQARQMHVPWHGEPYVGIGLLLAPQAAAAR